MSQMTSLALEILYPLSFSFLTKLINMYIISFRKKPMKKKIIKILNRYSLIYLPLGWVLGLGIIFATFDPPQVLYFLSFIVVGVFIALIIYTSNRGVVDDMFNFEDHEYSIIEFYSDYWLGCTASKFIVDEFKKQNPEIVFFPINASKQSNHPYVKLFKLFNTPTYVLVNKEGKVLARRVGTFSGPHFKRYIS